MNPFANMTPAMIDAHNARVAQRRADYAKGNPFAGEKYCPKCRAPYGENADWHICGTAQPIPAPETGKHGDERESKLHDRILAYCRERWPKWKAVHSRLDRKSTVEVGTPDFVILLPEGKSLLIECKKKGSKLTSEQMAWGKEAEMLGHTVYTVWSFEDFLSILRDLNLAK